MRRSKEFFDGYECMKAMMNTLPRRAVLMACGAVMAGLACAPAAGAESVYLFGVVPQFEQRKLFATWKPIVEELAQRSGLRLQLATTLTVPDFEKELSDGKYDFVYANPYHILHEIQGQGYIPLVRDKEPLRGILVVKKDSPLRSPAELGGKELAVPSFNALGASLLIRTDLLHIFQVKPQIINAKNHTSVYMNVAAGVYAAGGGVEKTLRGQAPSLQDQLRVLYTTRDMPSHPIAAHPRVTARARELLQKTILDWGQTPAGKHLLQEVPMTDVISTTMKDYLPMLKWGLDEFWVK